MGLEWQIMEWVQALYHLGGHWVDFFFLCCTFLGEDTFLLVGVLGIYWCWNKHLGEELLFSLLLSLAINGLIKDVVRRPRPFLTSGFEDRRYLVVQNGLVDTAGARESFSFPSGHSQAAGAFFGMLAFWQRKRKQVVSYLLVVLLVMLSRVYLGVHFPSDVLIGGFLGLASAWISYILLRRFGFHKFWIFGGATAIACLGLFFCPSPDTIKLAGTTLGGMLGLWWERKVNFSTQRGFLRRLVRLILGVVVLTAIRLGLKTFLPSAGLFDGLRYACMGLVAVGLWPWIFTRLRL